MSSKSLIRYYKPKKIYYRIITMVSQQIEFFFQSQKKILRKSIIIMKTHFVYCDASTPIDLFLCPFFLINGSYLKIFQAYSIFFQVIIISQEYHYSRKLYFWQNRLLVIRKKNLIGLVSEWSGHAHKK